MNHIPFLFILSCLSFLLSSCHSERELPELSIAQESDFEEEKQVAAQVADGFQLKLWAPAPLLSNAVALSIDNKGIVYVSETSRRKSSDIDIRAHWDWMEEDLAIQSIEDTRALHLKKLPIDTIVQNEWQEDFNKDGFHDYRDLEVQTEYIRRLWDEDGDGRADHSSLFADGFNSMLTGVAAGVLYHNDEVFLTAAPDLWRVEDKNGDGIADKKTSISHGYGLHIAFAGHDMSGLTIGPDGKIYWSIGDLGLNVVDQNGKRWAFPNQGAVMRANPDGSEFEVFAHGLRNPQELAFDAYGNLISVDNDGDHPGEHERFVHIVEGSDSGWRINWQYGKYNLPNESYKVWMDEQLSVPHFKGQAAYLLPPLKLAPDGPAGLAFNPGAALSSTWNNYFFASYFTGSSARSKIQAFQIKPKGASFEIINETDVLGGIVPTGLCFAPNGSLYINDWKDGYAKKPTGRIWSFDVEKSDIDSLRKETQNLLKTGFKKYSNTDLGNLLAYPDMRIRLEAQFELVRRNEHHILTQIAKGNESLFARLHGIWGVGQLARKFNNHGKHLALLLKDSEAEVRAQSAKVLGEIKYKKALEELIAQLEDESARAQFYAVEALGKLGDSKAFDPLVHLLEKTGDKDPHLRHAITFALSRLNDASALEGLAQHVSSDARIGAVVALRHMRSPLVSSFLQDQDTLVLMETARAIHDDFSIPEALTALANSLGKTDIQNEVFLRRAINANLRLGDKESAQRLCNYISNTGAPIDMRLDALWALGYWSKPMNLDRVEGRYRVLKGHQLEDAQKAFNPILNSLLEEKNSRIKIACIEAIGRLNLVAYEDLVFNFLENSPAPPIKKAALSSLSDLNSSNLIKAIDLALEKDDQELRTIAQGLLNSSELPELEVVSILEKILEGGTIIEKQKAFQSLSKINLPEVQQLLNTWVEKLQTRDIASELELDVLLAVENSSFKDLHLLKTNYENSKDSSDILEQFREVLYGGDVQKGRDVFVNHSAGQCMRCHQIRGFGGEVGPDLNTIAQTLNREELLQSLVDPNIRIAPGYGSVIVKLNTGVEKGGILLEENDVHLTIQEASGDTVKVFKNTIVEQETLPSGMFSMKELLNKKELRNLMAFLVELK